MPARTLPRLGVQGRNKGSKARSSGVLATHKRKIRTTKETMMRNEIQIVEDGVIFELEIEEVEEVVAPTVLIGT
jgi:hypothetical protein